MSAYNTLILNEVTTIEYYNCMENFLDDDDQDQHNFSNLNTLIMESFDANYGDISTPVPIVTKIGVSETISDNLIPVHAECEDNFI